MALSETIDITQQFNIANIYTKDASGWDSITVQLVNPSASVAFTTSNDSGAIAGVSDGNPTAAINFTAVEGVNLATNAAVTALAAAGVVRFNAFGRYLRLTSSGDADKIILTVNKIF